MRRITCALLHGLLTLFFTLDFIEKIMSQVGIIKDGEGISLHARPLALIENDRHIPPCKREDPGITFLSQRLSRNTVFLAGYRQPCTSIEP